MGSLPVLTHRQRQILAAISDSISANGYPPTLREIGATVGLSSASSVNHQLAILSAKGYIRRVAGLNRALTIEHLYDGGQTETAPDGSHRPTPAHPLIAAGVSVMEPSMPVPGDVTREAR